MEKPYHIIVLGNSTVGKTTLVQKDKDRDITSTVGVDFSIRNVEMPGEETKARIQFWDTAGQEIYNSICRSFYNKAECALLVFDLSNRESWYRIEEWFHELRQYDPDIGIVFIGNKSDLITTLNKEQTMNWALMWDRARELSVSYNIKLIACSNYTGEGTEECMIEAVRAARKKRASVQVPIIPGKGTLAEPLILDKEKLRKSCCK